MGMKKERKLLWISVCLLSSSDVARKEVPNGEQLNAKCSFSRRLFCKRSLPPDPLRRDQQKPASDQKRETHSQACHAEAGFDLDGFVTVWDEG
eukprot:superscaffoldBa00000066_g1070